MLGLSGFDVMWSVVCWVWLNTYTYDDGSLLRETGVSVFWTFGFVLDVVLLL